MRRVDHRAAIPATGTIVPAEPGTRVLEILADDGEAGIMISPVVAWFVRGAASPIPITVRGGHDGIPDFDYVVEFADGSIVSPTTGTWRSRRDFIVGMNLDQLALPLAAAG